MQYVKGEGKETNLVAAYKWLHVAAEQGNSDAIFERFQVAGRMTQDQIKTAQAEAYPILSSVSRPAVAREIQTKTSPTPPTALGDYRSIDPERDGFTVELSSGGSISWTAEGWMSSDSVSATAIGTTDPAKGAKVVLLESGRCINGIAKTKEYAPSR